MLPPRNALENPYLFEKPLIHRLLWQIECEAGTLVLQNVPVVFWLAIHSLMRGVVREMCAKGDVRSSSPDVEESQQALKRLRARAQQRRRAPGAGFDAM
jgi:hypothetical protein